MSFQPTQPLLANGHQAQAIINALQVRISVLETMLAESTMREMENTIEYRLEMESLKQSHEAEITALRNTITELLQARVLCLIHQLTGGHHHLSRPVAVAGGTTTEDQAGSEHHHTSGPEHE